MQVRNNLTVAEHIKLGSDLKAFKLLLYDERIYRVGINSSRQRRAWSKLDKALRNYRSVMEDAFCADYPKEFSTKVYYGEEKP